MSKLRIFASKHSMRNSLVGCSVLALTAGMSPYALAACVGANPVLCTGSTTGKVTLSTTGALDVANGSTLTAGLGDDAALGVTSNGGAGTVATISVEGSVSGNRAGIVGQALSFGYAYPTTRLDITVGANGQIIGRSAIFLDASSSGSGFRTVGATVDNSGLVQGSAYALEAVQRHGPARGVLLAVGRLLRCNPLHPGGYDPVP